MKELSKKSNKELRTLGYENNDIELIKNYEDDFKENIEDLNKLSDQNLKTLGYNSEQIDIIRNFYGTEEQMIKASATCSVSRSKNSFSYSNGTTNLSINISFKWNGVPTFRGTDLMAISNGEQMYFKSSSYLNVSYSDITGMSGASSSKKISANIHDSGNTGVSFKFKTLGNNGLTFAKSGSGRVYMSRQANLKHVGVGVKYGHTTMSISPSVSFPAGVGISFGPRIQEIGPKPLNCYR